MFLSNGKVVAPYKNYKEATAFIEKAIDRILTTMTTVAQHRDLPSSIVYNDYFLYLLGMDYSSYVRLVSGQLKSGKVLDKDTVHRLVESNLSAINLIVESSTDTNLLRNVKDQLQLKTNVEALYAIYICKKLSSL